MLRLKMFNVCCFILILPIVIGIDPCSNPQLIDEPRRSADNHIPNSLYQNLICDRSLAKQWYTFKNGATLAKNCTRSYHCGTHIPLWMNGADPSVSDGIVVRQICGTDPADTDCCSYRDTIRVQNCGAFMIYELVPAKACSFAYCAGSGVPCPPHQWSKTGFMPCVDLYPNMVLNPTLSNPILKPDTFEFNCHINFNGSRTDVGFYVEWVFDNTTVVSTARVQGSTRDVTLNQTFMKGQLGKTLECRVGAFFTASPTLRGPLLPSKGYWCGIKLETTCLPKDVCPNPTPCHVDPKLQCTPSLRVDEKETKPREVRMISTVPVVCDAYMQGSCHVEVFLDTSDNRHDAVTTSTCDQTITTGQWNNVTSQIIVTLNVSAKRDGVIDRDKNLAMHLFISNFSYDAPEIFRGYNLPYLPVHTIDKATSQCSCISDPHCKTLDDFPSNKVDYKGNYYEQFKSGEFIMYESTASNRLFQVQTRTWPCNGVTCNCAVAAREGNDIIIIDMCQGTHAGRAYPVVQIINKQQTSHGAVVYEDKAGHYLMDFLSGAQVKVDTFDDRMDIYITAPEVDYAATQGLCGFFDEDRSNDLRYPDGHHEPYPNHNFWAEQARVWQPSNFIESWRVRVGDSLFDKKYSIVPDSAYDQLISYCDCDNAKRIVDCSIKNIKTRTNVQALCPNCKPTNGNLYGGRKKRASNYLEDDSDPPQYFFDYGLSFTPQLRDFPTRNGKTRADAQQACENALNHHATVQQCIPKVDIGYEGLIHECVEDFKYFDDGSMIQSITNAAVTTCAHLILKNVSFYDAHGNPPSFITTDRCQSDCSGHGTCEHGTCNCNPGFAGDGCEINAHQPPEIYNILVSYQDSSLCDVTVRPCETIFLAGNNFHLNSNLKCLLNELKFDGTGFVPTGRKFTTNVQYNNLRHIGCQFPTREQVAGNIIIGFNISVTNDGNHFSNVVNVYRIDSTCLNCRDTGEECQIKVDFCVIDGACRRNNEFKIDNNNLKCDPAKTNTAWSSLTAQNVISTPPTAPLGGITFQRFDIWTTSKTGCQCAADASSHDCACCDDGGCQCAAPNQHQCTICGSTASCGNPQPGPDMGVDGYTLALSDCACDFNRTQFNCACCNDQVNACQCGQDHQNQCVDCNHMEQCGNKPWIFGPPFPTL